LIFEENLGGMAERFLRVESVHFGEARSKPAANALRIAITRKDGSERQKVVYLKETEERQLQELKEGLRLLVGRDRRLGLAAISQLGWELLSDEQREQQPD
jgi:hypothetical protein